LQAVVVASHVRPKVHGNHVARARIQRHDRL
jgi:hypothetical protein